MSWMQWIFSRGRKIDIQKMASALLDLSEDELIIDSAADSLLQLWSRQERTPDPKLVCQMHPAAKRYFESGDA